MKVKVKRLIGWDAVLRTARTTVGKEDLKKEPSDAFKKAILISEHSPIRMLTYEVTWEDIPYFAAMHLRTHHVGFKAVEDDNYFIETSRADRKNLNRDELPQTAPVSCCVIMNAQSILNVSRVRLCSLADKETLKAWQAFITELFEVEPLLAKLCQPNCIYRGRCPEGQNSCNFTNTTTYEKKLKFYDKFF